MAPVWVVNELNLNPHPLHTTETQRMGHPAIGCHMANYAYFSKAVAMWDQGAKKIVKG